MSALREAIDWLWTTRRRALALGFTHEGTHFGMPIYCRNVGEDDMEVFTKSGALEWVIDVGAFMLQYANAFREPGDQLEFAFLIREIEVRR